MTSWRILEGDCRESLAALEPCSVQTCVTSPPYFGLRDYGTGSWEGGDPDCTHSRHVDYGEKSDTNRGSIRDGPMGQRCDRCAATSVDRQIGLEPTPDEFVAALVGVFRAVRRVLRDDGTVWLNLGDSYASSPPGRAADPFATSSFTGGSANHHAARNGKRDTSRLAGTKPKDLIGIPWMVAFALRADGWYLRSDIIWAKPNPMPESVTDRPTKAHEYLFLLSKGPRYFYDADAIREPLAANTLRDCSIERPMRSDSIQSSKGADGSRVPMRADADRGANRRSVWTVATQPYPGAHFATFPPKLIEPCILAGTSPKACGECGAPWQRVVKHTPMEVMPTPKREAWQAEDDHTQVGGTMTQAPTSETVGWKSTCAHDDDTGSCVVLDPFSGSGTTGIVALRHNRAFVGIELSGIYATLARWRIRDDAPLLNGAAEMVA